MSRIASALVVSACVSLSACSQPDSKPKFRSFDLDVSHPSPYATFLAVAPGANGARLPRMRQLNSKDFNTYLRDLTGCAVDQTRETHVIGHKKAPAGYMVPIICVQ
ncbi:hypothetical protein [Tateyamaria pelophila]|uniref:hypothetical protein n=1 Tax=Tateyamaria pelophila TaxID=328415 RepID=UPI001CBFE82F|nr:hypothetical protein [Tateyamaria pelophila]